jgi:hypothetical protein
MLAQAHHSLLNDAEKNRSKIVKIWFIKPASCLVILAVFLHQRFAYLDLVAYIETAHDLIDQESDLVPYLGSWYEDYKALNSKSWVSLRMESDVVVFVSRTFIRLRSPAIDCLARYKNEAEATDQLEDTRPSRQAAKI